VQTLLLFLAVLLAGAAVFLSVGRWRGPQSTGTGRPEGEILGLVEPVAALPPVLLPERPRRSDVDALRLGVGLRGYRCDQVDEVLGVLSAEIERLRSDLDAARRGPVISATNQSPE
jgi:hypothetical protein